MSVSRHVLLLVVLFSAPLAAAQSDVPATSSAPAPTEGYIIVDATDGVVRLGSTDAEPHVIGDVMAVQPFEPVLVFLTDAPGTWKPRYVETKVMVQAGDTLRVPAQLPVRHRIESMPIGADVVFEYEFGRLERLGETPRTWDLPPEYPGTFIITMDGYQEVRIPVDDESDGIHFILLQPIGIDRDEPPPVILLPTQRSGLQRRLVDWGIGAATVAAGAVAVHYKFRADDLDDDYRDPTSAQRGVESLRKEAERFDHYSGLALGAMQIGFGVLAVRFVLR